MRNFKILKQGIIGIIAGIICGFFSTGGGMILVPAFVYLLKISDKKARGTSIFCILPMVITSSFYYYRGNYINWNIAIYVAIGGAVGGFIGAKILKHLPDIYLKIIFTVFIFYIAIKMLY